MPLTSTEIMDLFILTELSASNANIDLITKAIDRIETALGAAAITEISNLIIQAKTTQNSYFSNPTAGALIKAGVVEWAPPSPGAATTTRKAALSSLSAKVLKILGLDGLKGLNNRIELG